MNPDASCGLCAASYSPKAPLPQQERNKYMSYKVRSGGSRPPIYEKERAVRMARKLGLRVISTSHTQDSPEENAESAGGPERASPKRSRRLSLAESFKMPLTGEGAP